MHVSTDICIEPELLPVTDEELIGATTNSQAETQLNISANGARVELSRVNILMSAFNPQTGTLIRNQKA